MVVFQWKMLTFFHLNITDSWGILHFTRAFEVLSNSTYDSQKEREGEVEHSEQSKWGLG